jgi:putative flippase GtrA
MLFASIGGGVATGVDVSVLASLAERGVPIGLAAFLGSVAGAGFCFAINKYIAFRDHRPLTWVQLSSFATVAAATAILMSCAMFVVCDLGGVPYLLGKLICALVVFFLWSYPAQRSVFLVASS